MRKIRVGQVGLGWFGSIHLQVWAELEQVELVAVCDRLPGLTEELPSSRPQDEFHQDTSRASGPLRLPPSVARYQDAGRMLREQEIDLLDVVATESEHFPLARMGLEAGCHVLVEKPFTLSAADARELIELAARRERHLYVGQILRFDPRYRALAETVHGKKKGLRHLSFQRNFQVSAHSVYGREHPFYAACVHDIDLALWLAGRPPARVLATSHSWLGREHPDVVVGLLEWDDGLTAVIQNVWHLADGCPYGFEFETKAFAEGATYVVRNEPVLQVWEDRAQCSAPELFFWPYIYGERRGAIVEELRHFSQCAARNEETPLVPLNQINWGIAAAEALVRSARSGRWEEV